MRFWLLKNRKQSEEHQATIKKPDLLEASISPKYSTQAIPKGEGAKKQPCMQVFCFCLGCLPGIRPEL